MTSHQMNRLCKSFFLILSLGVILISCSSDQSVQSFEGGKLFRSPSGSIYIAELHGTFHQMGRQYGLLLKQQLAQFYQEAVTDFLIGERGEKYADIVARGQSNYDVYPQIFKDYFDGIAETSGLATEQVRILSNVLLELYIASCSSLSAWGAYTPDGKTITGRNLDLAAPNIRRFARYFHVVVWNPTGYPASVANIDFIGGLFYQTAINNKGIFLELQNGQMSDTSVVEGRENVNNILIESLFRNTSSAEVDRWFNTTLTSAGLIMNGSFPDHATIYEWATFRMVARNAPGLLSASNDFIDPSWHGYPIVFFDTTTEGSSYTVTRRTNLLGLGELNKGQITPQKMMEIFDQAIPVGATFPETGEIRTIYSVVAQPSELKIWLKVRGYSGWEEIDLKKYFSN